MSESDDGGTTMLRERLRTYGAAVGAQRRPVDVDRILAGAVTVPRRRVERRPSLVALAGALGLLLLAGTFVVSRRDGSPHPIDVIGPPATPATAPATTSPSSNEPFIYRSPEGHWELRARRQLLRTPGESCESPTQRPCQQMTDELFEDGVRRGGGSGWALNAIEPTNPLAPMGGGGAGGSNGMRWALVYITRPDVARVEAVVTLLDGTRVPVVLNPVNQVVGFITWTPAIGEPPYEQPATPDLGLRAFAADGSELEGPVVGF